MLQPVDGRGLAPDYYAQSPAEDPLGPEGPGLPKVIRGACWHDAFDGSLRVWRRSFCNPSTDACGRTGLRVWPHAGAVARRPREPCGDYEGLWLSDDDRACRCPDCGREYMKAGRRFMRRLPDGALAPYMVWKLMRGYVPDTGPP